MVELDVYHCLSSITPVAILLGGAESEVTASGGSFAIAATPIFEERFAPRVLLIVQLDTSDTCVTQKQLVLTTCAGCGGPGARTKTVLSPSGGPTYELQVLIEQAVSRVLDFSLQKYRSAIDVT